MRSGRFSLAGQASGPAGICPRSRFPPRLGHRDRSPFSLCPRRSGRFARGQAVRQLPYSFPGLRNIKKAPAVRREPSSYKISTPHPSCADGGLPIADLVQWTLPRTFLGYRSDAEVSFGLRWSLNLPIHEIAGHADVCSDCSRVAHHREVRFVFGKLPEITLPWDGFGIRTMLGSGFRGSSELASPLDSLPSCVYNVQYFFRFVKWRCANFTFSTI